MSTSSKFFSKKPDVVEAIQWDGGNADEIIAFASVVQGSNVEVKKAQLDQLVPGQFSVQTASGFSHAKNGDYIIKDHNGNLSVVSKEDFEDRYEGASAPKNAKKRQEVSKSEVPLQAQYIPPQSNQPVAVENNPALNPPIEPAETNKEAQTNKAELPKDQPAPVENRPILSDTVAAQPTEQVEADKPQPSKTTKKK